MAQVKELTDFWNTLKSQSSITFKDLDKIEKYLGNIFQSFSDLIKSREKWKETSKEWETKYKKLKASTK